MKKIFSGVILLLLAHLCFSQEITLEDIWLHYKYYQPPVKEPQWMRNSDFYTTESEGAILKMKIESNELVDTLFYMKDFQLTDYELSFDEQKIILQGLQEKIYRRSFRADYFIYDLKTKKLDTLTTESAMHGTLSPDGKKFAYVHENNLFVKNLETDSLIQLTYDGEKNKIINGSSDWVYEEEFMFTKAFFWSPDSEKIAYYRFDETDVSEYNMQVWGDGLYPQDYVYKYPKAGEEASSVQIMGYSFSEKTYHLLAKTNQVNYYIPHVNWVNADLVSIAMLNRKQNELEVYHQELGSQNLLTDQVSDIDFGKPVFKLHSEKYLEVEQGIYYLNSEWAKAVFITETGRLNILNNSNEVVELKGVTGVVEQIKYEKNGRLFYEAISDSKGLERNLYKWENGKSTCLTCFMEGTNTAEISPDAKYFFNKNSTINRPCDYTLHLVDDPKEPLAYLNKMRDMLFGFNIKNTFQQAEFITIKNKVGDDMNAYIIKPKDFKKKKKYPLLMHVYGGPGHQLVKNEWQGMNMAYHQLLAQEGFVVACVDGRGTGGKGEEYKKCTYRQLGKLETQDQITAAKYLGTMPFVDPERIGIWGWSYGGYISSLCIFKGYNVFKTAISVAPVTNWKYYDNIYTERYMDQPMNNAEGYEDNSPLNFAHQLEGNYLLVHGTSDDNVHLQNAIAMQKALINANKQFDVFFYPDKNHGIYGGNTRYHLYKLMMDYLLKKL